MIAGSSVSSRQTIGKTGNDYRLQRLFTQSSIVVVPGENGLDACEFGSSDSVFWNLSD
jgi:hypothetical protein